MTRKELEDFLIFFSESTCGQFEFPCRSEALTEMRINVWYDYLKNYDKRLVFTAYKQLSVEKPGYIAKPGEIVKAILEMNKAEYPTPGQAWAMVMEKYNDFKQTPEYPGVILEAIQAVGGWRAIGDSSPGDTFFQNNFRRAYSEIVARCEKVGNYLPETKKLKQSQLRLESKDD